MVFGKRRRSPTRFSTAESAPAATPAPAAAQAPSPSTSTEEPVARAQFGLRVRMSLGRQSIEA
jgi:hypothetical protein